MWHCFGVEWAEIDRKVAHAPRAIIAAMGNLYTYSMAQDADYSEDFFYEGDASAANFKEIEKEIGDRLSSIGDANFIFLGGEHVITYAVLSNLAKQRGRPHVVHFDAHLDMQDSDPDLEKDGKNMTRATFARRSLQDGLAKSWTCIGIRDCAKEELDFAKAQSVAVFGADKLEEAKSHLKNLQGPVYVTIDLDVLDPSVMPKVSVPVPGGLSTKDLLSLLSAIPKPIGFDVVELAAPEDKHDQSAMAAAWLVREYLAGLAKREAGGRRSQQ